ncbi:unnamed protein product [Orchesella dallaii]|uniref:Uncharacterized protein n=1 Tax=Orchesella dallaii TaxID=48710 RepID=A0ABP1RI40_9HEXA
MAQIITRLILYQSAAMENNKFSQQTHLQETPESSSSSQRAPLSSVAPLSNSNKLPNASSSQRQPPQGCISLIPTIPASPSQVFALNFEYKFNNADPNTKENFETTFQSLGKSLDEANQNNRQLYKLLQSKKSDLKTSEGNEMILRTELGSLQQKYKEKEQENINLRGDLQTLKNRPESVPKTQYEEILKQKMVIAANNEKVSQQNEELLKKREEQQEQLLKLQDKNEILFGENEILREELDDMENQLKQQSDTNQSDVRKLGVQLEAQKIKIRSFEETLSQAENVHRTEVQKLQAKVMELNANILDLNMKLGSSSEQANSLMEENVNLANKIESLKKERETLQKEIDRTKAKLKENQKRAERNEKEPITTKNKEVRKLNLVLDKLNVTLENKNQSLSKLQGELEELKKKSESELENLKQQVKTESERARQANATVLEKYNAIEIWQKRYDEQNLKIQEKSKCIAGVRNLLTATEKEKNEANALANKLIMESSILKLDKVSLNDQLQFRLDENRKMQSERDLLQEKLGTLNNVAKELKQEKEELQIKLKKNAVLLQTREVELTEQKESLDKSKTKILELEQLQRNIKQEELHPKELNNRNSFWATDNFMDVNNFQYQNANIGTGTSFSNPLQLEELSSEDEQLEETKRWKSA